MKKVLLALCLILILFSVYEGSEDTIYAKYKNDHYYRNYALSNNSGLDLGNPSLQKAIVEPFLKKRE